MAEFKYVGEEERTFDGGFGRGSVTVATGDVFHFAGPVGFVHLSGDLEPADADTKRQVDLLRDQTRIADARDSAAKVESSKKVRAREVANDPDAPTIDPKTGKNLV